MEQVDVLEAYVFLPSFRAFGMGILVYIYWRVSSQHEGPRRRGLSFGGLSTDKIRGHCSNYTTVHTSYILRTYFVPRLRIAV